MKKWHLAQLNVARALAPVDSPQLADFVNNLDRINALADTAVGFVWRLQSDSGNATDFRPMGDEMLINMSVWEDLESLHHFVYRTAHVEIMRRRKEWFERMKDAYTVLWWVEAGVTPSVDEALERLEKLRQCGPTQQAFTFAQPFAPPGSDHQFSGTDYPHICPA